MRTSDIVMWAGFLLIIIGTITFSVAPREEVKTDCYDRYGSQIEELECNKTVISDDMLGVLALLSAFLGIMAIFASISIGFDEVMREW